MLGRVPTAWWREGRKTNGNNGFPCGVCPLAGRGVEPGTGLARIRPAPGLHGRAASLPLPETPGGGERE